ncbi:flagellar protein FlaG [Alteromonas gilva]|uniref:Flagellar protein FlaG n=1 Tax=Alteromonas gilva TaxID=2987522 RepID=A0ABT5L3L3_9ALTE|nr:flagellar protein FlaG [Alteromonas gilva]MDC8830452.1 flagellar protein FlaG [Alteromonas gilva]
MDVTTSQIGQNFAVNNLATGEPQSDVKSNQATPESAPGSEQKKVAQRPEDTQAQQNSADNYNREEQGQEIAGAVQEIQTFLQAQNRNLAFSVDENTNRSVVTVKDSSSGDVIRQIPSDEVLRLAERIKDLQQDIGSSVGVLFNKQA